jgi:DNA primase
MKQGSVDLGLTSGSRGMHVNVRIQQRWGFSEVRRAAVTLAREIERRVPALASSRSRPCTFNTSSWCIEFRTIAD